MRFSIAITGFKISLAADRYSPRTISAYVDHLTFICKFLDNPDVATITESDLRSFFAWLNSGYEPHRSNGDTSPLAGSSINKFWIAMRSFWRWLESENLVTCRPDRAIRQPKYETKTIVPFTVEETKRLLLYCQKSRHPRRDTALLLLMLDTGLRAGEVARLTASDIDLESGSVTVRPFGSSRKSKPRTVFLGKSARRAVWRYLAQKSLRTDNSPDDRFINRIINSPDAELSLRNDNLLFNMTVNSLRLLFSRLGRAAGVANCHPHRMRHTFAVNAIRNGASTLVVQRLLGHATPMMTSRYVLLAETDLALIHQSSSPVDVWKL